MLPCFLLTFKWIKSSLDSVRFRESKNFLDENILHAYGDMFIAFLQGEGIVVTENQLMDSPAFIRVASKLIIAAREVGRFDLLNITVSLYGENSVFDSTAKKFGGVGSEERNHEDRFVLSGWPKLDEDYSRRSRWADKFRAKEQIPETKDYISHPEEFELAQMLYIVLQYFDSEDGSHRKMSAGMATPIRIKELQQIARMPHAIQAGLFDGLGEKETRINEGVIKTLLRMEQNGVRLSERSEILTALTYEGNKPNEKYFYDIEDPVLVREATLLVVDSIYNHSLGVASHADLISNTDKVDPEKDYLAAANSLASSCRKMQF